MLGMPVAGAFAILENGEAKIHVHKDLSSNKEQGVRSSLDLLALTFEDFR